MRLSVTAGDRSVDIYVKGHSTKQLLKVEAVAHRLLTAAPQPPPRPAFGYTAVSDHTPSYQEDDDDDDTDRTAAG